MKKIACLSFSLCALLLVILLFSTQGCVPVRSNYYSPDIDLAMNSVYKMELTMEYRVGDSWIPYDVRGAVFSLGAGYVVGLTHVFGTETILQQTFFGMYEREVEPRNIKFCVGDKELVSIGYMGDVALFKAINAGDFKRPFPFKWGDTDKMRLGDNVLIIGWPWMQDKNVRAGIVSDLDNEGLKKKFPHTFSISADGAPGDSGTPVLGYRYGRPVLLGMMQGGTPSVASFVIKGNHILECVERIKAANEST